MENYTLSRSEAEPGVCPFLFLSKDTPQIRVKDGSKIRNLLRFALSRMEPKTGPRPGPGPGSDSEQRPDRPGPDQDEGRPGPDQDEGRPGPDQDEGRPGPESWSRCVVFTAAGKGASKAITCAEIVKRRVPGLHQVTRVSYSSVLDSWDPLDPGLGLDSLTVTRKTPRIWILLSAAPLDRCMLGYQTPGRHDDLWANKEPGGGAAEHKAGSRKKRGGGARAQREHRPQTR
ncbi:ribonuclease P protein subunit p25-like protein [Eucyclogobius newberryi]|uniref:ribonuclease P protein subunit p25-like protein n=1 Tax=Eucyclogobius newberryi TaxID=166745 RepID=UPI003B593DFA